MDTIIKSRIEQQINQNAVVLYMKGSPDFPRCGFSKTVVDLLNAYQTKFTYIDVLEEPAIREGIKQYSDWPTIPQLYVLKKFIGGCDIVKNLYENGTLKKILAQAEAIPKQLG